MAQRRNEPTGPKGHHRRTPREVQRERFRAAAKTAWAEYRSTGLHLTAEEADTWLARLEAGEEAPLPDCHR